MDLETENRIATILLKEAAELRRQAEKEGVHAYLRQPTVRGRPNSRFLTATVLGIQQSNRAVEVNETWRIRQKELELDERLKRRHKDESSSGRSHGDICDSPRSSRKRHASTETNTSASCSSSERVIQDCYSREDEGFREEEIEKFLHSRVKRGRGAVGSRMDETGPYLPSFPESKGRLLESPDVGVREGRESLVLGPEKPSSLKYRESSKGESSRDRQKPSKKVGSGSSRKRHSGKHRSKEKSRDKKKRREEKRCKRHK